MIRYEWLNMSWRVFRSEVVYRSPKAFVRIAEVKNVWPVVLCVQSYSHTALLTFHRLNALSENVRKGLDAADSKFKLVVCA